MALTLEQYALDYLDTRGLPWPAMPKVELPKARPSLVTLPVRAVLYTVYGTLLAIPTGELQFEAQLDFVTEAALDKTVLEFKMWQAMSRKPGKPGAQLRELFKKTFDSFRLSGSGGEKHPELLAERIWDEIIKKLIVREYKIDTVQYGSAAEFTKKIAYFYHASIQGTGCYPGTADTLKLIADRGIPQGLLGDGQCFTPVQLLRGLHVQDAGFDMNIALPGPLRVLSSDCKARKPSHTIFQAAITALAARGISPAETLHVGSNLLRDITPAKKLGMKTALFAGDKASLAATGDQLKDPALRPDVLVTELIQLLDVIS